MAALGAGDGEAPRMEITVRSYRIGNRRGALRIIEMSDEIRRNREDIVNGLNIFFEENEEEEEEETSLEELEEEFDLPEEEETENVSEDGCSKEAHEIIRAPQKVSLRSISSMTDEERLNLRIKKFGIITDKGFRKSRRNSCYGFNVTTGKEVNADMEKKRKRLERFGLL